MDRFAGQRAELFRPRVAQRIRRLIPDGKFDELFAALKAKAGWHLNELSDITRSVPLLERVLADRERESPQRPLRTSDNPYLRRSPLTEQVGKQAGKTVAVRQDAA
jgi:hypothetical protein